MESINNIVWSLKVGTSLGNNEAPQSDRAQYYPELCTFRTTLSQALFGPFFGGGECVAGGGIGLYDCWNAFT